MIFVHPPYGKVMKIDHRGIGERNPQQDPRDTGYPFWVIRVRRENLALERFGAPTEVKSAKISPSNNPRFQFSQEIEKGQISNTLFQMPAQIALCG